MASTAEPNLRFVPSAVEGLPSVTEAAVFPDRLELLSEGQWVVIRFLHIARWHRWGWLYRPLARLGFGTQNHACDLFALGRLRLPAAGPVGAEHDPLDDRATLLV